MKTYEVTCPNCGNVERSKGLSGSEARADITCTECGRELDDAPTREALVFTAHHAAQVLHHVGRGGYPGGGFADALIAAIFKADSQNQSLLALGFPRYVAAVQFYQNTPDSVEIMRQLIKRQRENMTQEVVDE